MRRLCCIVLMCLVPASATADNRTVLVDASLIVSKVAEELGADRVGLLELVTLSLNDAATACGIALDRLRAMAN